ncbi:MAG: NYN domain-containing protein [Pseudomonadota bacterium]|nr:NYN domain-containing protein [Pseudomonadota bacterium]
MPSSYAILIDGGYAKRKLGKPPHYATAEDFRALIDAIRAHDALRSHRLHRVYYYDSLPLESAHDKPLEGGKVEFALEPVATRARQLFEQLWRLPFVALRLGELSFEGWAVKSALLKRAKGDTLHLKHTDLQPSISQKGVDMRIGMDIAALTLKKQAQVIVLVTGDSDFVPAMKFARREGAQLFLVPLGQRLRPAMYEHTDLMLDIPLPVRPAPPPAA